MPTLTVKVSNPKLKTNGERGLITCSKDEKAVIKAAIQCDWYPNKAVSVRVAGVSRRYMTKNLELV